MVWFGVEAGKISVGKRVNGDGNDRGFPACELVTAQTTEHGKHQKLTFPLASVPARERCDLTLAK